MSVTVNIPPEDTLHNVRKLVREWLDEEDNDEFESNLKGVFDEIAKTPSPVHTHQVLSILREISSLITSKPDCMPLLNWPWLHPTTRHEPHSNLQAPQTQSFRPGWSANRLGSPHRRPSRGNYANRAWSVHRPTTRTIPPEPARPDFDLLKKDRNLYRTIADVLSLTRGSELYARGNGLRLFSATDTGLAARTDSKASPYTRAYLCQDEEFLEEAPQGRKFQQWYSPEEGGRSKGKGITLAAAKVRQNFEAQDKHKHSTPEFVPLCAVGRNREEVESLCISVAMSVLLVQAVSISQGVRGSRVHSRSKHLFQSGDDTLVGSQIAILAAVYSELSSPRASLSLAHSNRYDPRSVAFVTIASGLDTIPPDTLENNMYWVRGLGIDKVVPPRNPRFTIMGIGNALFRRDLKRPIRWFLVGFATIGVIATSVLFQSEVAWAEKLEKFLNLIFTVAVATAIGLASVNPEKDWLRNVLQGRRLISIADETSDDLFADILSFIAKQGDTAGRFLSPENSSWVAPYRYGTTKIGRAVHLNDLEGCYLSVSKNYDLCFVKGRGLESEKVRRICVDDTGLAKIAGLTGRAGECTIMLPSRLRMV